MKTELTTTTTAATAAALLLLGGSAFAADHLDSPSVQTDGRLDINDLYAFQSPAEAGNTVLILTVNPLAGIANPTTFNPKGDYELHVDNDGDAAPDVSFRFYFSAPDARGAQRIQVLREDNSLFARGATGETFGTRDGGKAVAGTFDDPFFFDLAGFQDGFAFTGDDFFAGLDVSAIVLEIPSAMLGGPNVAVWGRTTSRGDQFDRMGRPAINTALIPAAKKDAFNASKPGGDAATFGADVSATIEALNGGDSATAAALAGVLLPDVLTFDTSSAAGFLNGRRLADDVIDAELGLLTNGAVTGDGVDANDVPFRATFPYLAPAHGSAPAAE